MQQGLELAKDLRPLEQRVADERDVVARLQLQRQRFACGSAAAGRGAVLS